MNQFLGNLELLGSHLAQQSYEQYNALKCQQLQNVYRSIAYGCKHNDCPICKKEQEIALKEEENRLKLKEQKKKDYQERCKKWMNRMNKLKEKK